jgi:uncharacterized membrane protein
MVHSGAFHAIKAPGAPNSTRAIGINDFGTIVGAAGAEGFVLRGGKFSTVMFPGSRRTSANSINKSGFIVGTYGDATGFNHGFLLQNGKYTSVDFPGATNTSVFGINNEGDIVGNYDVNGGDEHGFALERGAFFTIDNPNATLATIIFGVNNHGQIVGSFVGSSRSNKSYKGNCSAIFTD